MIIDIDNAVGRRYNKSAVEYPETTKTEQLTPLLGDGGTFAVISVKSFRVTPENDKFNKEKQSLVKNGHCDFYATKEQVAVLVAQHPECACIDFGLTHVNTVTVSTSKGNVTLKCYDDIAEKISSSKPFVTVMKKQFIDKKKNTKVDFYEVIDAVAIPQEQSIQEKDKLQSELSGLLAKVNPSNKEKQRIAEIKGVLES